MTYRNFAFSSYGREEIDQAPTRTEASFFGHNVTINKADYSQATGKFVKVSEQKIMLDLTKGVKGVETNVYLTIEDENGKEHTGFFIYSQP